MFGYEYIIQGYYVETISNITDEVVQIYKRASRRVEKKKIPEVPLCKRTRDNACNTALRGEQ